MCARAPALIRVSFFCDLKNMKIIIVQIIIAIVYIVLSKCQILL